MNYNSYFMIDIIRQKGDDAFTRKKKKQNQLYLKSFAETTFLRLIKKELVRLCVKQKQTKGLLFFDPNIINFEIYILQSNGWAINSGAGTNSSYTLTLSCLLYTSPSPRDRQKSRMPSSA